MPAMPQGPRVSNDSVCDACTTLCRVMVCERVLNLYVGKVVMTVCCPLCKTVICAYVLAFFQAKLEQDLDDSNTCTHVRVCVRAVVW